MAVKTNLNFANYNLSGHFKNLLKNVVKGDKVLDGNDIKTLEGVNSNNQNNDAHKALAILNSQKVRAKKTVYLGDKIDSSKTRETVLSSLKKAIGQNDSKVAKFITEQTGSLAKRKEKIGGLLDEFEKVGDGYRFKRDTSVIAETITKYDEQIRAFKKELEQLTAPDTKRIIEEKRLTDLAESAIKKFDLDNLDDTSKGIYELLPSLKVNVSGYVREVF